MQRKVKIAGVAGALVLGVGGIGAGIAAAGSAGDDDDDRGDHDVPIEGTDLDRASQVALDHTGEGEVTETEVGDEESYYEVEVTLDDGSQVDVQLDEQFHVVGDESDGPDDD